MWRKNMQIKIESCLPKRPLKIWIKFRIRNPLARERGEEGRGPEPLDEEGVAEGALVRKDKQFHAVKMF